MSYPRFNHVSRNLVCASLVGLSLCAVLPSTAFGDTASELAAARSQLEEIGRQADQTNNELTELTRELESTRADIDKTGQELLAKQDELSSSVNFSYKTGSVDVLQLVFNADSFSDLLSNVNYMNKVASSQAADVQEVKRIKQELTDKQAQQEQNVAVMSEKVEALNAQRADAAAVVNSLDAELQEELRAEAERNAALSSGLDASTSDQAPAVEPEPEPEPSAPAPAPPQNNNTNNTNNSNGNTGGNQTPAPSTNGSAVVARAYAELGKPYVWGGVGPSGYDCSGLVSYCLTGSHSRLGTTYTFMGWPQVSNPQPGDICVSWGHTGIYIGNGQMIHAPQPGDVVKIGPVQSDMIYVRY